MLHGRTEHYAKWRQHTRKMRLGSQYESSAVYFCIQFSDFQKCSSIVIQFLCRRCRLSSYETQPVIYAADVSPYCVACNKAIIYVCRHSPDRAVSQSQWLSQWVSQTCQLHRPQLRQSLGAQFAYQVTASVSKLTCYCPEQEINFFTVYRTPPSRGPLTQVTAY